MSNQSSFTKELWMRGWPLDEAAHRTAPRELLDQLKQPYPKIDQPAPLKFPADSGWTLRALAVTAALSTALGPILDHHMARTAVRDEIRDNLLVRIEGGEFIAIGYVLPRKHNDLPVEILIDLWERDPDWNISAISGHGLEYVAVRIIPANWLEKTLENIVPLQIAPPPAILPEINLLPPGRPSMEKFIIIAFEELKKFGKIDFLKYQVIAIGQVRETVKAMFPSDVKGTRGLGDEAIRKVICENFRKEREALKSSSKL